MKFKNKFGYGMLMVFLAGMGAERIEAANKLSPAEVAAGGWELLFDGTSTTAWTINWPIDDSAMKSPGTGAMNYTKKTYDNFEWRVDFKVDTGGNSGFFIRTKASDWYCDGFEVAVLDSKNGGDNGVDGKNRSSAANGDTLAKGALDPATDNPFSVGGQVPIKRSGAIYDLYPPTKDGILIKNGGVWVDRMRPAMVWNTMVIWVNGKNIETWLNGMKITDFVIGTQEYLNRYSRSKFYPGCGDHLMTPLDQIFGIKNTIGKLVVQDHGGGLDIWMRNNKIRPIYTAAALPKPLITPNGGTYSGVTKVNLDAGMTAYIRYTLDASDPTESSPLYTDSTGITISKPGVTTVLAKTFRPGFTSSTTSTATFTLPGTSVLTTGHLIHPEVETSYFGNRFVIRNQNNTPFSLDIIGVNGQKVKSLAINKSSTYIPLADVKPGLYVVKMHVGEWSRSARIVVR